MSGYSSCKNCTERQVGCHSTCEKYISEKIENDRARTLRKNPQREYHPPKPKKP